MLIWHARQNPESNAAALIPRGDFVDDRVVLVDSAGRSGTRGSNRRFWESASALSSAVRLVDRAAAAACWICSPAYEAAVAPAATSRSNATDPWAMTADVPPTAKPIVLKVPAANIEASIQPSNLCCIIFPSHDLLLLDFFHFTVCPCSAFLAERVSFHHSDLDTLRITIDVVLAAHPDLIAHRLCTYWTWMFI